MTTDPVFFQIYSSSVASKVPHGESSFLMPADDHKDIIHAGLSCYASLDVVSFSIKFLSHITFKLSEFQRVEINFVNFKLLFLPYAVKYYLLSLFN